MSDVSVQSANPAKPLSAANTKNRDRFTNFGAVDVSPLVSGVAPNMVLCDCDMRGIRD